MQKLAICRICLIENAGRAITDPQLQEIYEKLTNIPFQTDDMRPLTLCYICHARLSAARRLTLKCLKAEEILTLMLNQLMSNDEEAPKVTLIDRSPLNQLSVTEIKHVSIASTVHSDVHVKEEVHIGYQENVKLEEKETVEMANSIDSECDNEQSLSDPEDDIPLNNIKKNIQTAREQKKIRVRKKERCGTKKGIKLESREILLSKEQQIENLLARAKSINYINSPLKCEHCYKGFVNSKAYANHKEKHDERSGAWSCEICSLRYSSRQRLRTHAAAAHARLYQCTRCQHLSHTKNQARVHEKWHDGYTYECQLCSHTFKKPTSYLSHMRKRHPTEHVCDICGESFVGKHGLQMHRTKTHKHDDTCESADEPATERFCGECNIQFRSRAAWQRHILSSVKHALANQASGVCGVCGAGVGGAALAEHVRGHARGLRPAAPPPPPAGELLRLHCQQCGANFLNRSKLQAHINRIHLGLKYNKNIVCEVCGKKCTSNATLKYHQRTHTGERPYACGQCSARFADSNQRRLHARVHSGDRPYGCGVCGKRFTQKPALNRHYRVHTGVKPYTCQYCARTFSQSNSMKLHVRTVHLKLPAKKKEPTKSAQNVEIPAAE